MAKNKKKKSLRAFYRIVNAFAAKNKKKKIIYREKESDNQPEERIEETSNLIECIYDYKNEKKVKDFFNNGDIDY